MSSPNPKLGQIDASQSRDCSALEPIAGIVPIRCQRKPRFSICSGRCLAAVAQRVGVRHGFETKQFHQHRFALEVEHIVQTAAALMQQQHERVEQSAGGIAAVSARHWHGLIHRLAQPQLRDEFSQHRQSGARGQIV